jgi:MFS family permease
MNTSQSIKTVLAARRTRLYHGWRVVDAAFVIALFSWGVGFYRAGIYLQALQARQDWPTAEIAPAITLYYALGATLIVFAGRLFDRFGPRRVVAAGATAMACGLVLLAHASHPWHVYAAFAAMSVGWASMSGAAINIIVAPWFEARRGFAISLALNGSSAGGIVIAPALIVLIDLFGFTAALEIAAGLMLVVLLPTATLLLRRRYPSEHADATAAAVAAAAGGSASRDPAWDLWRVIGSAQFQTISLPFALELLAQVGFLTHQMAFLSPIIGTSAAGWAVSLTTFCAVTGRLATSLFIDKVDRRVAACGNFLVEVGALALLATGSSTVMLYLGCALFGLGVGNMITLRGMIVQQEFPRVHFSRVISLVVGINQFTFAFGPALLGYLQGGHGDYSFALLACLVEMTAAVIVVTPVVGRLVCVRAETRRDRNSRFPFRTSSPRSRSRRAGR